MLIHFDTSLGLSSHTWGEETLFDSSLFANECVKETGEGEGVNTEAQWTNDSHWLLLWQLNA